MHRHESRSALFFFLPEAQRGNKATGATAANAKGGDSYVPRSVRGIFFHEDCFGHRGEKNVLFSFSAGQRKKSDARPVSPRARLMPHSSPMAAHSHAPRRLCNHFCLFYRRLGWLLLLFISNVLLVFPSKYRLSFIGIPGLCEFCEGAARGGRLSGLRQPRGHHGRAAAAARAGAREGVIPSNPVRIAFIE